MGLLSWLFPTDADRLRHARAMMAQGRHEKARAHLVRCSLPEAEALYDECCAAVDKADRPAEKKRLAAAGFHGWKIDVVSGSAGRRKELEGLVAQELTKAGVDLEVPDVDEAAVKAAVARAQRRASRTGRAEVGAVRLVPIVDAKLRAK
jgi:hypothetical protein